MVGYYTLGGCLVDNVIESLSSSACKTAASAVLLVHLVTVMPIVVNPTCQYFEDVLRIPKTFNWKRCAFRTLSMAAILFVAESVPSFGNILDLVGASTITMLTFVFPPLFYILIMLESDNR